MVICFLLLLASAVNYMDRQTLAVTASRIKTEFELSNVQYGRVEAVFGYSFALGSILWGFLVDRFSVRWIYPIGLLGWSLMGFLTGWPGITTNCLPVGSCSGSLNRPTGLAV
jgi:ACS family hexuronate transporter-like MFS transporter